MPFQRTSSQPKKNARAKSPARSGSHRKVVYSLTNLPDFPIGSNVPTVQCLGRPCGWGRPLGDGLGDE
jgi:hypothetical protein